MAKPFLFDVVNALYNGVMDHAPKSLQERSMFSALALGYVGNYLLTRGIQKTSEMFMSEEFNKKHLPLIEEVCIYLTIGAPLLYMMIDSNGMQELIQEHPTYVSGMLGAGLGAITAAQNDIKGKKSLENKFDIC
ncbi:MAG: hypothetical protein AABX61_03880 [Nanoarchaeota archaeon]